MAYFSSGRKRNKLLLPKEKCELYLSGEDMSLEKDIEKKFIDPYKGKNVYYRYCDGIFLINSFNTSTK